MIKAFLNTLTILLIFGCSSGKLADVRPEKITTTTKKQTKVKSSDAMKELLSKMTLEEKVGQMTQINGFWDATGPVPEKGDSKEKYEMLRAGKIGSVLNVVGVENVKGMQKVAVEETRLGIPLIFAMDVIHGHKTLSPIPLAESASWDLEAIEKSARIAAIEASARGLNWTFAPMVDISRDARWGRVMEGGGEDPFLGSKIAMARVKGFQGDDLSANNTIAACAKHFAGYGFVESGKDYNAVDVGTSTLYNVILPPFKACVDAGSLTFMNSFNTLNGIPATGDKFLQRDVLKKKWGYEGFIVSDWSSGKEMIAHGFAKDLKDATIIAANAGSDMDMESYGNVRHLKQAVEEGKVSMEVVDEAVLRILNAKEVLGLFADPYRYCDLAREKELVYHEDHMAASLDLAKKSMVLLKNENQLLPLSKDADGILVIGDLAQDKDGVLGNWRMGSDDNSAVSFVEALKSKNIPHTYEVGPRLLDEKANFFNELKINTKDRTGFDKAVNAAKSAKTVVMMLGENGFMSGEAKSRSKLDLSGLQQELLEAVFAVNKNIVLVVMSGRPLVLSWADENIPSILQAWQPGSQAGNAIAEVLFGDHNPGGKLPMTFPRALGQVPIYYNYMSSGRPGPSEAVFWVHHMDVDPSPLYPFGHGLSYTKFEYSNFTVTNNFATSGKVSVSVQLSNTGDYAGREIVQLYIRDKFATVTRPVKELKGFELVNLEKGATKTVNFELTEKELGFFDNQGNFIFEEGSFNIFVGGSSDCKLVEEINVSK